MNCTRPKFGGLFGAVAYVLSAAPINDYKHDQLKVGLFLQRDLIKANGSRRCH